ncbi:hypothetical protein ACP275_04G131200 [Erythranthe tilingii]
MAAAYAALVSLTHTLHQILHPPPTLHIIFDRKQIETLQQKTNLLIDFLEKQSSNYGGGNKEIEHLETRIRVAADGAEYTIEFNVMNQILAAGCAVDRLEAEPSDFLSEGVRIAIQEFRSIQEELVKMIEKDVQPKNSLSTRATSTSSKPLPSSKDTMVGFQKHLIRIMTTLTANESNLRIISIVGMGGIGKTTLATNVFNKPLVLEHFHLRAWVTISKECKKKEILLGLLLQISNAHGNAKEMNDEEDTRLGDKLYKELFGRKYLIVMDDMWDIKAWEIVKRFLPNNNNGSRILVTTRLLKLAEDFGSCSPYQLNLLDESQSWDLLREKVFVEERCPVELEVIGKSIAKKCRGLPLALVVIGGVLAKSKTEEHWKYVEEDVTSEVNNEDDEFCMKILFLSYIHLPIYLKPCFLYFAVFPQDHIIKVSRLVRLWVAEGFIRKYRHKSLEETGEEYLEDLIHRNLILVNTRWVTGEVRTCRIHDLLSDLCRREAQKDNFVLTANLNIVTHMKITPRLSINSGKWKQKNLTPYRPPVPTQSFLSFSKGDSTDYTARRFPLLRLFDVVDEYPKDEILQLINSRYVSCMGSMSMPSSISQLWSLQTLVVYGELILPSEIWQMPQLRHVEGRFIVLSDPLPDTVHKIILLENLQTLSKVKDFKCSEAVMKRIPNLKKLEIICGTIGSNRLSNLGLLHKLEHLNLELFTGTRCGGGIVFPSSLKELTLTECKIHWEDMSVVGSLPNLEVLSLRRNAAIGQKWISKEGEFARLKSLWIHKCELEIWEADDTHFPSLEIIHLGYLNLKEIPSDFAGILPLRGINLDHNTNNSLLASANKILEERENLGYDVFRVLNFTLGRIRIWVKRGINLVGGGGGDPYVVITMADQVLKARAVTNDVNPEWYEDLIIYPRHYDHQVSLTVYGHNKSRNVDEKMGEAEFDIGPLIEVAKVNLNGHANDTIITRIPPASSNCLAEESFVFWKDGIVTQDMRLRLKNIERGQVEIQLRWLDD